jgi:hypothetical protein
MSKTIELAQDLISRSSISPEDGGCQAVLIEILSDSGFLVDNLKFGEVYNFWATHGSSGPVFVFAGHTDVVPVGDRKKWLTDPFIPTIKGDLLYGRGASFYLLQAQRQYALQKQKPAQSYRALPKNYRLHQTLDYLPRNLSQTIFQLKLPGSLHLLD